MLVQEYKDGCYVLHEDFVYFFSNESGSFTPVCDKPNCMHDKETDAEKKKNCIAHLDNFVGSFRSSIQLYNGNLYVCYEAPGIEGSYITRIAADGSHKEKIYTINDMVIHFFVHRGNAFVYKGGYQSTEDGVENTMKLVKIPLNDLYPVREESINCLDELGDIERLYDFTAYGNYLCFGLAYKDNPAIERAYVYDIVKDEINEITIPDMSESTCFGKYTFFDEKLFFQRYELNNKNIPPDEPTDIYCAEPDGSNPRIVLSNVPLFYMLQSDGKYFYTNNFSMYETFGKSEKEPIQAMFAYDTDLKQVDTIGYPENDQWEIPAIGGQNYYYEHFSDDEGWGLKVWDKSLIGTYNGKAYVPVIYRYE